MTTPMAASERDLFGYTKKTRRPRLEAAIFKHDRETLAGRIERLRHLQTIFPKGYGFLSSLETAFVFDEAKMSYINGQFIGTILLAQAHIEHGLQGYVAHRGETRLARSGLAQITKFLRKHNLLHTFLLDRIDRVRKIRNPFTHLAEVDSPHRLTHRAAERQHDWSATLQDDAEFSLSLMYEMAVTRL
jgi:hypothetical protein